MSFSKEIKLGDKGSVVLSEANGVATLKVSVGVAVADGVAKAVASAEVDLEAVEIVKLALDLLKAKLPAGVQGLVTDVENAALAELAKV